MCWRIFVCLVIASVARASLTLPIVNGPQYRKLVPRIVGLDTIDVGERGWPELVDLGTFAVCRRNWLTDTVTRLPNADGDGDLDLVLTGTVGQPAARRRHANAVQYHLNTVSDRPGSPNGLTCHAGVGRGQLLSRAMCNNQMGRILSPVKQPRT